MRRYLHRDATMTNVRATVNLDDDVAAGIESMRRERGVGLSEALNELARAGLVGRARTAAPVRLSTRSMRLRLNVTNVAEALDAAEHSLDR